MANLKVTAMVSVGELLDKVSILLIKEECVLDRAALAHVRKELKELARGVDALGKEAGAFVQRLTGINRRIWGLIDAQTALIAEGRGESAEHAKTAMDVVVWNQERFRVKREADAHFGSAVREVKQHLRDIPRPKE